MVLLSAVLGLAALTFSLARWHRGGPRFHSLLQFLLMGVNGAFLTGDLFNLFVFFEVLLASSYGLALHGSGPQRVGSGLHYIAVNLAASLLFLIGATLIYGVTGTLNMADLAAAHRDGDHGDRVLFEAGGGDPRHRVPGESRHVATLFLAAGHVWRREPAVERVFAVLTKVGVYAVLRTGPLFFGADVAASPLPAAVAGRRGHGNPRIRRAGRPRIAELSRSRATACSCRRGPCSRRSRSTSRC